MGNGMKKMLRKRAMVLALVFSMLAGVFGFTENAYAKAYSWMDTATLLPAETAMGGVFTRTGEKIYYISVPETMDINLCVGVPGTKTAGVLIYGSNGKTLKSFYSSKQWSYSKKNGINFFEYSARFSKGVYYIGIKNFGSISKYALTYSAKLAKKVNLKNLKRYSSTSTIITWTKLSSVTGYEVYRATSLNGTYKRIATASSSRNYYIDRSITNGRSYYYFVKAYRMINGKKIYSYSSAIGGITLSR